MDAHRDCDILQTFGSPQGNGNGAPRCRSRAIDDYCIILTGVAEAEVFNGTRLEDHKAATQNAHEIWKILRMVNLERLADMPTMTRCIRPTGLGQAAEHAGLRPVMSGLDSSLNVGARAV